MKCLVSSESIVIFDLLSGLLNAHSHLVGAVLYVDINCLSLLIDLDGLTDLHANEVRLTDAGLGQCHEAALQAHLLLLGGFVELHLRVAEDVTLVAIHLNRCVCESFRLLFLTFLLL